MSFFFNFFSVYVVVFSLFFVVLVFFFYFCFSMFGFELFLFWRSFFSEVLGLCVSIALVWVVMEVLVLFLGFYLVIVRSDLSIFYLLVYSGYNYVGWVFVG